MLDINKITKKKLPWDLVEKITDPNMVFYNFGKWWNLGLADPTELIPKCCEGGGDDPGPDPPTPISNVITLTPTNTGGVWAIKANTPNAPTSNLAFTIAYTYDSTEITENFTMVSGTLNTTWALNAATSGATNVVINSVSIDPESDDVYEYSASTSENPDAHSILYWGVIPMSATSINTDELLNIIPSDGDNELLFDIQPLPVEGYDTMSEEEYQQANLESAQDFVIVYDANDVSNYQILTESGGLNTSSWLNKGTVTVNGIVYTILRYSQPDALRNPYDPSGTIIPSLPFKYDFKIVK